MPRRAVVVGIDFYQKPLPMLFGCVNDARSVTRVLERDADKRVNFSVKDLLGENEDSGVTRRRLKDSLIEMFESEGHIALFYFAGHGYIDDTGGYLCVSNSTSGDDGLSLSEVITMASRSPAQNKIVILDCCHSGAAGLDSRKPHSRAIAELGEGMTILTASKARQVSEESDGSGVFTSLLVDAMEGAAANLLGEVTPGSVYAHIDRSLGAWGQRPVFKTHVNTFVSLRKAEPPIPLEDLQQIVGLFPDPGKDFALDPSYEENMTGRLPGAAAPNPVNVAKFKVLQKYNRVNLVVPVNQPHMWHAAMYSTACKLTSLGKHYWKLANDKRF